MSDKRNTTKKSTGTGVAIQVSSSLESDSIVRGNTTGLIKGA